MGTKLKLNRTKLAKTYGVSGTTVDNWVRRGCPSTRAKHERVFDLHRVAEWRAAELVNQAGRNRSGRKVCPEASKILGSLLLTMEELIPWIQGDVVTFPEYATRAGISEDEVFTLMLYGMPLLPPAEGEKIARISVPHADRWRGMFAIYVEGLGGDGLSNQLGAEAHRLRGLPPAIDEEETEDEEGDAA